MVALVNEGHKAPLRVGLGVHSPAQRTLDISVKHPLHMAIILQLLLSGQRPRPRNDLGGRTVQKLVIKWPANGAMDDAAPDPILAFRVVT